jgi:hypothetical protein
LFRRTPTLAVQEQCLPTNFIPFTIFVFFYCIVAIFKYSGYSETVKLGGVRLLVKPGTPEQRNTGTPNTGTPEQHHSGTRNTGTLKILNLLKIRKKNPGGCESIAAIIIA